ncbi:MAG: GspE/PulE family protein [Patescibacteria group bacterium]
MPASNDKNKAVKPEDAERHSHKSSTDEIKSELAGASAQISIIRLVDSLIATAFEARASDIHLDPEEHQIRVRFRVDGVLHDNFIFPKELQSEIITRIKILSGMRTDEHQAAQDGRFKMVIAGHEGLDVRVSIAPTYYGENCVMRLLAQQAGALSLESLGYSAGNLERLNRAIKKPYGMILATGPTGSGKTTSLYAILKKLNTKEVSIITVEDPIEYSIEGIDQIQVNARTGLTFAQGLRFILRQDPNIIMVGEIRDNETASIAVNAAMTGHLVLSTLHTNDAATTLPRLLDMGVEPFLIASTINVAIGQRLVRTICPDCRAERELTPAELQSLKGLVSEKILQDKKDFSVGVGCKKCDMSGFRGRVGIHEVIEMNDELRELIMKRATSAEIKVAAVKNGMVPMLEDGIQKAIQGLTTIEEVLRVFHE